MADIVGYKIIDASPGITSCPSGGLNEDQILKVARSGIQHDHLSILSIDDPSATRGWAFLSFRKRIVFTGDIPFEDGEKVYIIYKTTI